MHWYKIVDKDSKGRYKMLFHGIDRNRFIPVGEWIKSEKKTVRDGSVGTQYESGWHVMMNLDECIEYKGRFMSGSPHERVIVKVDVRGHIWPKKHSPSNVYLCEEIMIIEEEERFHI